MTDIIDSHRVERSLARAAMCPARIHPVPTKPSSFDFYQIRFDLDG